MTVSERGAATMELEVRQFFENVLIEIREARRLFPNQYGFVVAIANKAVIWADHAEDKTAHWRLFCVQIAALAARLAVEGDSNIPRSMPQRGASELDDLERLIGANSATENS